MLLFHIIFAVLLDLCKQVLLVDIVIKKVIVVCVNNTFTFKLLADLLCRATYK